MNKTKWHKHKDGVWHKATGCKWQPKPEFKYEHLGTPFNKACPIIGPIETLEAIHSTPTTSEVDP